MWLSGQNLNNLKLMNNHSEETNQSYQIIDKNTEIEYVYDEEQDLGFICFKSRTDK